MVLAVPLGLWGASAGLAQRGGSSGVEAVAALPQLAATSVEQLNDAQRESVEDAVFAQVELPPRARVLEVEPSFDDLGALAGGVAVVEFPPYSGLFTWPGGQLFESDDGEVWLTNIYEFEVVDLQRALVAVRLDEARDRWASPDPGARVDDLLEADEEELAAQATAGRVVSSRLLWTVSLDRSRVVDVDAGGLVEVRAEEGQ